MCAHYPHYVKRTCLKKNCTAYVYVYLYNKSIPICKVAIIGSCLPVFKKRMIVSHSACQYTALQYSCYIHVLYVRMGLIGVHMCMFTL